MNERTPIKPETEITVMLGVQSVQMTWEKIEKCFTDFPSRLPGIRSELERDGVSHHEDFAFFYEHRP